MNNRRCYKIRPIDLNGVKVNEVIIDTHYEAKHGRYMNDDLILNLVNELSGRHELPDATQGPYSYFATLVEFNKKKYRLIWLLEDHSIYIGIINAYRNRRS